jgi:hypothetical protein
LRRAQNTTYAIGLHEQKNTTASYRLRRAVSALPVPLTNARV